MSRRKRLKPKPTASAALPVEAMELMEIVAVNRTSSTVLLDDWETHVPMQMLDGEGEETDDGELAVAAVVSFGVALYVPIDLSYWEKPTLH